MASVASRARIMWEHLFATPVETPEATEPLDIDRLQDSLCIVGARHRVESELEAMGWPTDLHYHRMIDRLLEQEELANHEFESVGEIMQRLPHLRVWQGGRR